jgi:Fe-S-cluster-containing dehydrogenase component
MSVSRRDFIKSCGKGLLAGAILYGGLPPLLRGLTSPERVQAESAISPGAVGGIKLDRINSEEASYWRFAVDINKCIGCGKCVKACKLENNVPLQPEYNRTWVERYVISTSDAVFVDSPNAGIDGFTAEYMNVKYKDMDVEKSFFVPKLCNHCDKPPCVRVCPVGATYKNKEGVVLVNRQACIGCRYCIQACPFGARFLDPRLKVVDKCTWCYHRISKGLLPACVEVCPVGARVFGDTRDPESTISKLIREQRIGILKQDLGCENKVYYVGLEKEVQ